jgi:amidophosphoribosyltransferase
VCGIFGVFGHTEASNIAYLGLHALQHRGQESAGIASSDSERLYIHRSMGLVQAAFKASDLRALPGSAAIGHVRYSTAGDSDLRTAQPLAIDYQLGSLAVAHNGNLTNHAELRSRLEERGSIFQTGSDTEAIVHLIAVSRAEGLEGRIADALRQVEGAFSLLFLDHRALIAVRDPRGFRPLCIGMMPPQGREGSAANGGRPAYVVSSEPTSFELIGAQFLRDVEPGEMVVIDASGMRSSRPFDSAARRMCLFEYVYFARPDSTLGGISVYAVRKRCGEKLILEHPVPGANADDTIVVPVPDSGVPAAIGLSHRARLPFEMGLIRSHYVGRTFIEPTQSIRHFGVKLKLSPNAPTLQGKRVIVVDDSIVRGTTSRKLVSMLRAAGAAEIHVRISSPPTMWPCYYGINTPTRAELIASSHSVDEIRRYLTADSLGYLSLSGLIAAVQEQERDAPSSLGAHSSGAQSPGAQVEGVRASREGYCHACFSGDYPVPLSYDGRPRQLRLVNT